MQVMTNKHIERWLVVESGFFARFSRTRNNLNRMFSDNRLRFY